MTHIRLSDFPTDEEIENWSHNITAIYMWTVGMIFLDAEELCDYIEENHPEEWNKWGQKKYKTICDMHKRWMVQVKNYFAWDVKSVRITEQMYFRIHHKCEPRKQKLINEYAARMKKRGWEEPELTARIITFSHILNRLLARVKENLDTFTSELASRAFAKKPDVPLTFWSKKANNNVRTLLLKCKVTGLENLDSNFNEAMYRLGKKDKASLQEIVDMKGIQSRLRAWEDTFVKYLSDDMIEECVEIVETGQLSKKSKKKTNPK